MTKPQSWIEVIDPETGRKVDIVVSFHSDWENAAGGGEPREIVAEHVNRITGQVLSAILGDDPKPQPFEFSDLELPLVSGLEEV